MPSKHARRLALAALAAAGACSLPDPDSRIATFDFIWETLGERYPFFGRKHIDWRELGKQYRSALAVIERPHEFYHLLAGLLSELDDAHLSLRIPAERWREHGVEPTRFDRGDGLVLVIIGNRFHVAEWPKGDAPVPPDHLTPEQAMLPQIDGAEGYRFVDSLAPILFTGPPGSPIELQLRWRDGTVSRHLTQRPTHDELRQPARSPRAAVNPPESLTDDSAAPVLRIAHLSPPDGRRNEFVAGIDRQIDGAIERDRGLIIDLRDNGGGQLDVTMRIAARFLDKPYRFVVDVPDEAWLGGWVIKQTLMSRVFPPVPPRFEGPLAVLVDANTCSAAEHLARVLQRSAGAVLIGEPTAGISATLREVQTPDGSTLVFGAEDMFDSRGQTLQDVGVRLDVVVLRRLEDYARLGWREARAQWEERVLTAAQRAIARQRGD